MIKQPIQTHRFRKDLLDWYNRHKRPLPFRRTKDPFKIWLSEIMAQQTTMIVVVDYYKRFIKKYPTVASVAKAKEQDLMVLWQGLGYYARIRNFHKACQIIVEKLNGHIPKTSAELKKLPGIGNYTAAAISSISFNKPQAVIDGNVKRVLARLFCFKKEISSKQANAFFVKTVAQLLDQNNPGDFNQAMMELGALICTPKQPTCQNCPVQGHCLAFGNNPGRLPLKKKTKWIEKRMVLHIMHSNKNILLKKPTQDSLVKGMWGLPTTNKNASRFTCLPAGRRFHASRVIRHTITNKHITANLVIERLSDTQLTKRARGDLTCWPWKDLRCLPLGTLSRKALAHYLRG